MFYVVSVVMCVRDILFCMLFFSGVNMKVSIKASGSANVNVLPQMKGKAEFSLIQPLPVIIIQTSMCYRQFKVKKSDRHICKQPTITFTSPLLVLVF